MRKLAASTATALALVAATVLPGAANADAHSIRDDRGPALQKPANQLTGATIRYGENKVVWKFRIKRVVKKRTRVFGTMHYPGGTSVRVTSKYVRGERRTVGWVRDEDSQRFVNGLSATWGLRRDRVTVTLRSQLQPRNRRAAFDAFTVTKGWMHGPHCEIDENGEMVPCNDDYVFARVRRG